MRRLMLALAVAAAFAAPPAMAQTATDAADVRCLLSLQVIGADPKQRDGALRGIYYYLGKLQARGGISRLQSVVLNEGRGLNSPAKVQAELTRCAGELNTAGKALQTANDRARAAAKAATGGAPPAKK